MNSLRLHLASPPPDTLERPSAEDVARAKAISAQERAEAEAQIQAAREDEWDRGDAQLLLLELTEAVGAARAFDLLDAIDRYGVVRVRRWLSFLAIGMGPDVAR